MHPDNNKMNAPQRAGSSGAPSPPLGAGTKGDRRQDDGDRPTAGWRVSALGLSRRELETPASRSARSPLRPHDFPPLRQSSRLPPQTCKGPPASRICFMSRRTKRVSPLFAADLGGSGGGRAKPAIFRTRVLHGKEWARLVLGAGCTMGKATPRLCWARVSRPHSAGAAPAPSLSPEARAPAGAAAPDAGPLQRAHCLLCLHVPRWQGVLRRSTRARGVVTTRPRAKRRAPQRGRPSSWRLDRSVRV